jgi:hypothetical protein
VTNQELKSQILKNRSIDHWQSIIEGILESPKLFSTLISYAYDKDEVLSFRASWIMDKCSEQHPHLLNQTKIAKIVAHAIKHPNPSVTRASLRLLSRESAPKSALGALVNQCFIWLASSSSAVAVKVHAMQILCNEAIKEPDLINELILLIEDQMPNGSAAFKARARMVLKKLEKVGK